MRLSEYMAAQRISDAEMARRLGDCSVSALVKYRRGERFPRPDVLVRIREITEGAVTADDFLPRPEAA